MNNRGRRLTTHRKNCLPTETKYRVPTKGINKCMCLDNIWTMPQDISIQIKINSLYMGHYQHYEVKKRLRKKCNISYGN